ncbi:MAG: ectonucleotide pyrophosphatase/phosphodiesterase [Meiothermus sp.]|uniref:alkaline phosphatase family protein n=1 Tax=Meiothermus sp. TaxID=1955249 RepID=UPI0025F078DE|nr:ectonucleotide pyrophosphatase/phosphodiesterase [Meiothermus sp.]MCS7069412.1 ectonucleotide pyrophosphatase/phosphodiesterase [Meiothermus sp.]MCX7602006.1 ectonucleotide pyrophosphatase/phosphodiesterase [Meiothermus sp.]MDW8425911.1 ectonucleotide pyrophosphatase/phosphodiesterase [Meiothermus sp.]
MSRVLYVTIDGLRPDALEVAHTPHFQALMREGVYTASARSVWPSITLPCHMSLFHSLPPERHGVLSNTYVPMARPVPGLFEVLKQAGRRSGMFYSWEPLRDVARPLSLAVSQLIAYEHNPEVSDQRVVEAALPYLRSSELDFTFLYLGSVDEVGHQAGWMSPAYLRQVEHLDGLLGRVVEALPNDTVLLLMSDHGGHLRMHGTEHPEDMTVPFLAWGPGVSRGQPLAEPMSLLELAPTAAALLGVAPEPAWEGRALKLR